MSTDLEEQQDELHALLSIFDPDEFVRKESTFSGEFRVCVELPQHFTVRLKKGHGLSQRKISSLPPLCLTFDLPEDYPSSSAPSYNLNCCWLSPKQLSSLAAQLDDLYQTTGGAVVLFSWAQFLKHEALDFLGIRDVLEITSKEDTTVEDNASVSSDDVISDKRAFNVPSLTPGQVLLSRLLIHDAAQREKVFSSQQFDCGVCFTSWLGVHCVQLIECGHVFCRTCLAEFCKVQIMEGNVKKLTCLQASCKTALTRAQVRSLVGEELFSRCDRLLQQSSLDSMPDVMYCPRPSCASAVLTDSSSPMALCTVCSFAFCVRCKKTYHGTEDCSTLFVEVEDLQENLPQTNNEDSDKIEDCEETTLTQRSKPHKKMPKSKEGMIRLWEDYSTGTRAHRRLLEDRYGKHALNGFLENYLSEDWISFNCKTCPHCFTHYEKIGGCNHMTCKGCYLQFCWICLGNWQKCDCSRRHN